MDKHLAGVTLDKDNSASPWFRMGENINGGLTEPTPVKIKMHLSYLHNFTE